MKKILLVLLVSTLTSGCASIASKSHYDLAINSDPTGADFVVTDREGKRVFTGSTPAMVKLKASAGFFKNQAYVIELNKPGFEPRTYTVSSKLDGWYWGNLFIGGLLGMLVIDPATGAMYKLPESVNVMLDESTVPSETALNITTIDRLSAEQRARLQELAAK